MWESPRRGPLEIKLIKDQTNCYYFIRTQMLPIKLFLYLGYSHLSTTSLSEIILILPYNKREIFHDDVSGTNNLWSGECSTIKSSSLSGYWIVQFKPSLLSLIFFGFIPPVEIVVMKFVLTKYNQVLKLNFLNEFTQLAFLNYFEPKK